MERMEWKSVNTRNRKLTKDKTIICLSVYVYVYLSTPVSIYYLSIWSNYLNNNSDDDRRITMMIKKSNIELIMKNDSHLASLFLSLSLPFLSSSLPLFLISI